MAQTKRKRRSKHRGTAAGTIEARGRTGRKPNAEEQKILNRPRLTVLYWDDDHGELRDKVNQLLDMDRASRDKFNP